MKKISIILCCILLLSCLVGCKKANNNVTNNKPSDVPNQQNSAVQQNSTANKVDGILLESKINEFSMVLPQTWKNKYYVVEYNDNPLVDVTAINYISSKGVKMPAIATIYSFKTKDAWNNNQNIVTTSDSTADCESKIILEDEAGILFLSYPTGVSIPDDSYKEEISTFDSMQKELQSIVKTIKRVRYSIKVTESEVVKLVGEYFDGPDKNNLSYNGKEKETGYYEVSWANPGVGTGANWYIDPSTGDLYDYSHKKIGNLLQKPNNL